MAPQRALTRQISIEILYTGPKRADILGFGRYIRIVLGFTGAPAGF